ncbi:hypothetical protein ACFE04_011153 [Oxalis oulophora]
MVLYMTPPGTFSVNTSVSGLFNKQIMLQRLLQKLNYTNRTKRSDLTQVNRLQVDDAISQNFLQLRDTLKSSKIRCITVHLLAPATPSSFGASALPPFLIALEAGQNGALFAVQPAEMASGEGNFRLPGESLTDPFC